MNDIELRFVERDERTSLDTYVAIVRKVKILQYRHRREGVGNIYWTDWTDVPMEVESNG